MGKCTRFLEDFEVKLIWQESICILYDQKGNNKKK